MTRIANGARRGERYCHRAGGRKHVGSAFLAVVILLTTSPWASAINIVMNFNSGASDFPSYDPTGSKLVALMSSVETYYQDIFEASGTLTVSFYYDDLSSGIADHLNTGTSGGKPTSCRIRVGTDPLWYFDSDPMDNSEYDMYQCLYNDESVPRDNYFSGSPNDLLEVDYHGWAKDSAPQECREGIDLWSALLHEMGHGLGMNSSVASGEVSDSDGNYDYDFDADLAFGDTTAAKCYSSGDRYHLASYYSGMNPYTTADRQLPSATDIFAIETSCNWGDTTIDLKRKDFYHNPQYPGDFNDRGNWEGNKTPDSGDDVWVRHGAGAFLSANATVHDLTVANGSGVGTEGYLLRVTNNCTLDGGTTTTHAFVGTGELQVDAKLTVNDGAVVQLQEDSSLLDVDNLTINVGGELYGHGTVDIEYALVNNGRITVAWGNLVIDSDVSVNLDGTSENGEVHVEGGNLTCNKITSDPFDDYMKVWASRTATFSEGWVLGNSGTLYLSGGSTSSTRATIDGGNLNILGTIEVNQQGKLLCTSQFRPTSEVELNDANDVLYLYGDSTVEAGATITGLGKFYVTSQSETDLEDGVVIGAVLHSNGVLTIDGEGIGDVTVNSAFELGSTSTYSINASSSDCDYLDVNGAVSFDGVLDIDFSTMPNAFLYTVMTYTSRTGTFDSIISDAPSVTTISPIYGATSLQILVTHIDLPLAPVPEPGTTAMLAGAAAFGLLAWRRQRG